jgi:hypothetical protein
MSGVGPTRALSAGGAGPLDASVCVECANNELTTEHGTRFTTKVRTRPPIPSGHTRVRKLNTNQTPDPEWVSAEPLPRAGRPSRERRICLGIGVKTGLSRRRSHRTRSVKSSNHVLNVIVNVMLLVGLVCL